MLDVALNYMRAYTLACMRITSIVDDLSLFLVRVSMPRTVCPLRHLDDDDD